MAVGAKLPYLLPEWMLTNYGINEDQTDALLRGEIKKISLSKKGEGKPRPFLRWIDRETLLFVPNILLVGDGSFKQAFQAYLVTHVGGWVEREDSYVFLKFKNTAGKINFNEIARRNPLVAASSCVLMPKNIGKGGYAPQGVDLRKYLSEERNVQNIRKTWVNFLKAVEALHATGYIHADLKPWNAVVFPNEGGRVRLIDIEDIKKVKDPAKKYRCSSQSLICLSPGNRAAIFNAFRHITTISSEECEDGYNKGVINRQVHIFSKSLEDEKAVAALCLAHMYFSNRKAGVKFSKIIPELLGEEFEEPQKHKDYASFSKMIDRTIISQFEAQGKERYLSKLEKGVSLLLLQTCIAKLEGFLGEEGKRKRQKIGVPEARVEKPPVVLAAEDDKEDYLLDDLGDLENLGSTGGLSPFCFSPF